MNIEISAYPNPINTFANFTVNSSEKVMMQFVLVDEKLNIITSNNQMMFAASNHFSLEINTPDIERNKLYRVYYTFSAEGNENFYFGHGDIFLAD